MPDSIIAANGNISASLSPIRPETIKAAAQDAASKPDAGAMPFDRVSISGEGLRMQAAEATKPKADPPTWQERFGFREGERTLKNGNKEVVTIEDNKLEVFEYDTSGKLIKKVEGVLGDDAAVLDTEFYDENGRVNQTIHTELTGLGDTEDATTSARMSRTIQWFDNGQLTRRMHDSMDLESTYRKLDDENAQGMREMARQSAGGTLTVESAIEAGMIKQPDKLDDMIGRVTVDTHKSRYYASIQEYDAGRLTQDMTIRQKAEYDNITNRTDAKWGGMETGTTRELFHNAQLEVSVTNYDGEGNILRQAEFRDGHKDGVLDKDGGLNQSLTVSWYNKGELVKRSHGSLSMDEVKNGKLPERPSLLDALGLKNEEYSTDRPVAASGLLAAATKQAASEADHFGEPLRHDTASSVTGAYNTAGNVLTSGSGNNPYSISWTNEIYRDGELAARQVDKESAVKSPVPTDFQFHTGGGLTEDDTPAVVRRSSHRDESFENGLLKKEAEIESHEFVKEVKNGADVVKTRTEASEGLGLNRRHLQKTTTAKIDEVDRESHAAAKGFSGELRLTLDDVADAFQAIDDV